MSQRSSQMFEVSKEGLAQILERRGTKGFAITELYQNAVDEDVTRIDMALTPIPGKPLARIRVEDDSPTGFRDLRDAFVLFRPSYKKNEPEKAGRFDLGEKLILALTVDASIATTSGTIVFGPEGREHFPRRRRERGSLFEGTLRMTREEYEEACQVAHLLLPREGVIVTFNGEVMPSRTPVATFEATLPTELADAEGSLRPTRRRARVNVYEPRDGEETYLYELGIPVVTTGDRYHVSVEQKVPVTLDRSNIIAPGYLRDLRAHVLNATAHLIDGKAAASNWINDALEDELVDGPAVERVLAQRFGARRVVYDPSDPEANKIAASEGYTVIPGGAFSAAAWKQVRRHEAARPAGQVTPSPKPYSPDGADLALLPESEWTDGMRLVAEYARMIGREVLDCTITVRIAREVTWPYAATYGNGQLVFNYGRLGRRFFEAGASVEVTDLLIHELAHHYEADHLSRRYFAALTRIGARLVELALDRPELFTPFRIS